MREILERYRQPPARRIYPVADCRVNHLRRDGVRFSVQYDVRFEEPGMDRAWGGVVSGVRYGGAKTRRTWKSLGAVPSRAGEQSHLPARPAFVYAPDLDMLIQVFSFDDRLPGLARLVEGPPAAILPQVIRRFGPGDWLIEGWETDLVRYRVDQRGTLRIRAQARDDAGHTAERWFFAKVYRDQAEGQRGHFLQVDFKPDHLLFDRHRVAVIDLDLLGLSDSLGDVATVVMHLARGRDRATHSDDMPGAAVHAFLAEYLAHASPAVRNRLPDRGAGVQGDSGRRACVRSDRRAASSRPRKQEGKEAS